jgi:hypothetical protein
MYDKDDMMPGAMKKVAGMKAKNKMSKATKTGKMLDRKEMMDAPRKPFMTKNQTNLDKLKKLMENAKKKGNK